MSSGERITLSTIRDGTSNTILVGETVGSMFEGQRYVAQPWTVGGLARGRGNTPWMNPSGPLFGNRDDSVCFGFGSAHHIVNFVYADGSVHGVPRDIDWKTAYALFGMSDGEAPDGEVP